MQEKLIILSAPSGSGKTSIVKYLLAQPLPLAFSISATSREKREGERENIDYYFITSQDFKRKIEEQAFVEWEEVYQGCFYGTLKSEIERIWTKGKTVVLDMDVVGGMNVKKKYGNQALSIFIKTPDMETLTERLKGRGTETEKSLQKRIEKAHFELSFADQFDVIVVNDCLEDACNEILEVVKKFIE
jgi:guanylate kinase